MRKGLKPMQEGLKHQRDMEPLFFPGIHHAPGSSAGGIREDTYTFPPETGLSGSFSETRFGGILIRRSRFTLPGPVQFEVETATPFFEMHFALNGIERVKSPFLKEPVSMEGGQHNMVAIPAFTGDYAYITANESIDKIEILLTRDFFANLVNESCVLQCSLLENLDKGLIALAGDQHLDIAPHIQLLLTDILQCRRSGYLKKMYLEAKVLELLMLQTEAFETGSWPDRGGFLQDIKRDLDKIHAVKELIDREPEGSYTLTGLAREAGINTFKLKKGFRALFGQTVFGYIQDLKMEKARRLLLEGVMNVSQAAYILGYNTPNNFSAAFKRKYGINPGKLKNSENLKIKRL